MIFLSTLWFPYIQGIFNSPPTETLCDCNTFFCPHRKTPHFPKSPSFLWGTSKNMGLGRTPQIYSFVTSVRELLHKIQSTYQLTYGSLMYYVTYIRLIRGIKVSTHRGKKTAFRLLDPYTCLLDSSSPLIICSTNPQALPKTYDTTVITQNTINQLREGQSLPYVLYPCLARFRLSPQWRRRPQHNNT